MRRVIVLFLTLGLLASGCRSEQPRVATSPTATKYPITIKAANGDVEIPSRPTRIVSLSPTATEMLFAIGAGKQVIAADSFSNYPPGAPKTDLSGHKPNVEAITTYRPDLVVFSNDTGGLDAALKTVNTPAILQPAAETLDDSYEQIEELGLATGNAQKARDVVGRMKSDIAGLVNSAPKPKEAFTYYHELDQTFFSATSKTFIGQVYGLLGLKNIADEADEKAGGYPQLSAEYIIKANPDFIFLADTKCCGQSQDTVAARPGWDQITAVRERRVVPLDDDIASRWGPRIVDYLKTVSRSLRVPEPVST